MKLRKKRMERYIKIRKIGMIPCIMLYGFTFYLGNILLTVIINLIQTGSIHYDSGLFDLSLLLIGLIFGSIIWNASEKRYEEWKLGQEI